MTSTSLNYSHLYLLYDYVVKLKESMTYIMNYTIIFSHCDQIYLLADNRKQFDQIP